jgi:AraC-like DNA-binding protein
MHIDKQTIIDPVMTGYEMDPCKRVLSCTTGESSAGPHAATRAQIMYATGGPIKVITSTHIWMVMPSQAIWIPAGETHELILPDRIQLHHIFFDASVTTHLPDTSFSFDVHAFFRELVLRIQQFNNDGPLTECEYHIVQVLLDEISALEPATLNLPLGAAESVQLVTAHLINTMQVHMSVEEAAELAHVSVRSFSREFVNETGISYRDWCLKLTLLEAIRRLQAGESINQVAFEMGYEDSSAFTYMFHKSLGKPPCLFLERPNGL